MLVSDVVIAAKRASLVVIISFSLSAILYIINAVGEKIASRDKINFKTNQYVIYPDGKHGFADLVNISTGETWEIKRQTISLPKATKQLNKYISANNLKHYPNLDLKVGGPVRSGSGDLPMIFGMQGKV